MNRQDLWIYLLFHAITISANEPRVLSTSNVHWGTSIVAIIAICVGIIVTLFGYKLFRPILFISGFVVGGIILSLVAEKVFKEKSYVQTASWIAFLIGGVVLGALVLCIFRLGVFMVGAVSGVLLAFMLNTSCAYKWWPSNPDGMLVILIVVLGLLFGAIALWLERPVLIISTSFFGAVTTVWGIGYFAGKYPSGGELEALGHQLGDGKWVYTIPSAWWGYLTATLVLWCIGMIVQFKISAVGVNHNVQRPSSYQQMRTP